MDLKLIIVDPKYQLNVGYIARISKNFGIKKLYFVKPRANLSGKKTIMYSKHARDLIENAKIYDKLEDALDNCDVLIGTTGIHRTNPKLGDFYTPEKAVAYLNKNYDKKSTVGIVIGRDDKGLNAQELELCYINININANPEYPVLNISHAVAIILYEFKKYSFIRTNVIRENVKNDEIKMLISSFDNLIKNKKIRDKNSVKKVFRKILRKSQLDKHDIHSMISAFK
ncbi:MAG: TrmJ/YjtD family RNA methyltransferase [Candidatus Micrarchaeaceae archaeon]